MPGRTVVGLTRREQAESLQGHEDFAGALRTPPELPPGQPRPASSRRARSVFALSFRRSIGKDVDDGMVAVECDNPRLKGALRKNCGRADLGKHRLGELIAKIPHNDRWSTNTEGQRRLRDHR